MFLKSIHKYCKTEKNSIVYYRLCESYRDEYGTARQRMVISLGRLEELPDIDEKILLIDRINEKLKGSPTLFKSTISNTVEQLAHHFY